MNESSGVMDVRRRRRQALPLSVSQSVFEWAAIALLLCSSIGGMWLFGGVRIWLAAPVLSLTMLGCLMVAVRPLVYRDAPRVPCPPGFWPLTLVIAWAAYSSLTGSAPYDGRLEWVQYFSLLAAYWAWPQVAAHKGRWRWILFLIIFAVTLMALYALVQEVRGSRMVLMLERSPSYGDRASGAYFCPNHFANILEMLFPVCLALLLCASAGFSLRLLSGYALVVMIPALYLTQSRSGWMATMAGLAVMLCAWAWRFSGRRFVIMVLAAPIVMAAIGFGSYAGLPKVKQRVDEALTGNMRIVLWKDSVEMIRDRPWTGHGLGSFRWRYPGWQKNFHEHKDPEFAHNEVLHTLSETGTVGLALIIVFSLIALAKFTRNLRGVDRDKDAFLIMGLLGAGAACVIHSAFDYNFHLFANNHLLFALMGVSAAGLLSGISSKEKEATSVSRWLLAIGVMFATVYTSTVAIRAAGSDLLFRQGERHRENFDYEDAERSYRRALRWGPKYWRPYIGLGDLRARQSFWNRVPEDRLRQMEEATQFYREAIARNPWDLSASYGICRILTKQGNHAAAIELLEKIVEKAPMQAFYLVELGEALETAGRDADALTAYERSQSIEASEMAGWRIGELKAKLSAP